MTSLLFHNPGGKSFSPSSSSSSSSNASPFQALAHLYEQELSDHYVDHRLGSSSLTYPRHNSRLFPSTATVDPQGSSSYTHQPGPFSSSFSSSSSSVPVAQEFRAFSQPTQQDSSHHHHHHHQHHHHTLSSSSPSSSSIDYPHSSQKEFLDYLRQRQEYYTREAQARSQDRHDGLGPIIDYEQLFGQQDRHRHSHSHSHDHSYPSSLPSSIKARRASSQQEQVWMDLLRPTPADSLNTIEASATMTNSNSVNDTLEKVWKNASPDAQTRVAAGAMPKTTLNYLDAAASIPSSWPMAPWAIRTEAALMEFEAIYRDDAGPIMPPTAMQSALSLENDIRSVAGPSAEFNEVEQWSREFLNAVSASAPTTATAKEMSQETKSDPSKDSIGTHSTLQEQPSQRRGSLKTCGFMWDGKRTLQNEYPEATLDELYAAEFLQETEAGLQSEGEKNFPLREAQEPSLSLVAGSEPMTYRTDVMTPSPVTPLLDTWALEREQVQECIADFDRTREQEEVQNQRGKREMEQAVQGGYNDDVFESDMLTAWMETLAQEKKESVEQKAVAEAKLQRQEQSKETASAEDSVILEMAVRRLNALMHQLDRRPVVRSTPGSIQVL